jgi:hypothetical protein
MQETLQSRFDGSTIITGKSQWAKAIGTACSFSDLELDVPTSSGVNTTILCSIQLESSASGLSLRQARAILLCEFLAWHLSGRLMLRFERFRGCHDTDSEDLHHRAEAAVLEDIIALGIALDIVEPYTYSETEGFQAHLLAIADQLVVEGLAHVDPGEQDAASRETSQKEGEDSLHAGAGSGVSLWERMRSGRCGCGSGTGRARCRLRLRSDYVVKTMEAAPRESAPPPPALAAAEPRADAAGKEVEVSENVAPLARTTSATSAAAPSGQAQSPPALPPSKSPWILRCPATAAAAASRRLRPSRAFARAAHDAHAGATHAVPAGDDADPPGLDLAGLPSPALWRPAHAAAAAAEDGGAGSGGAGVVRGMVGRGMTGQGLRAWALLGWAAAGAGRGGEWRGEGGAWEVNRGVLERMGWRHRVLALEGGMGRLVVGNFPDLWPVRCCTCTHMHVHTHMNMYTHAHARAHARIRR